VVDRPGRPILALFMATLALRPTVVAIGPLATSIGADLHVTGSYLGLLTTIPVLCMGVFAPLGPLVARRLGTRPAMAVALSTIAAASGLRALAPTADVELLATAGLGVGIGIAGALPTLVAKLNMDLGVGRASGASTAGIVAGAILAGAAAVPLASALGGWRQALAVLAGGCLLSLAGWLALYRSHREARATGTPPGRAWRRPLAWVLGISFGLQAIVYWGATAWLPGVFIARGWDVAAAGGLVGLVNASALVANLGIAAWSDRITHRPAQIVASAVGMLVSVLLLIFDPDLALIWTAGLGVSLGAIFPLLLAMSIDVSRDGAQAASVAAFMLLIGYSLAAVGPFGLGLAHDASGGFGTTVPILAAVCALLVGTSVLLAIRPGTYVPDRTSRRTARTLGRWP
jgi:CP family cyanate transporter-like MFS transporter